MFCPYCGKELKNNALFCGFCGKKNQYAGIPASTSNHKDSRRKPSITALIIILLLVVIIGVAFALLNRKGIIDFGRFSSSSDVDAVQKEEELEPKAEKEENSSLENKTTIIEPTHDPATEGILTVAIGAVVIARDDVPEDEIYDFVSAIFENTAAIGEQHGKGKELDLNFASSITSVPYHPGAAKYFAEKGIAVATVKDGAGIGKKRELTFGTGSESGTYYAFGCVLSSYVNSQRNGVTIMAVPSGGSRANIEDLMVDDVQLGFAQSDVMSYAYKGERIYSTPIEGFSVVAALYMEQVQIVTTNSKIASVADLKGKTVSIGAVGSGVCFNAIDVLEAYGLTEKDFKPVYQSFGDSADSLKEGKIDAAFIVAGVPTKAVTDLATTKSVYLIPIDKEYGTKLEDVSPFYSVCTIPDGTYGNA